MHSLQALAQILPASENIELIKKVIELLPAPGEQEDQEQELFLSLMHSRFWLLRRLGRIDDAVATINWAIDHLPEFSESTAGLMSTIYIDAALAARDLDRPRDVFKFEHLALDCVRKSRTQGGRSDRALIDSLQRAADAAIGTGQFAHSENLLEEAFQIIRNEFPEGTPLLICLLATRGRLNFVLHKYRDAIADLSIAIRALREFDPTDLLPAALLHAAQCHAALGDMNVAIKMAREAHSKDAEHYGDNHPETKKDLEILNSLLRRA